ncbi:carboxy-S-adenosyl-L-methionine synthase CmoA [bacterium]|nr:carboxy-S-adenosyl-L-methionine synthase CmoA [bacterium]
MPKDEVFKNNLDKIEDFTFNNNVASVFNDMVSRSVPFYHEIQRMITEIAADFVENGKCVYDLGCSTGTTLLSLNKILKPSIKFVGIDNSPDMLDKCRANFIEAKMEREYILKLGDLNQDITIENASVVIMCLTLQFVRPMYREKLIKSICAQLKDYGCLILVEKVLGEDSMFNRLFIKYYYEMKRRNHYSEMEISQKREALENVLIPYKLLENRELLLNSGFRYVDTFFKWYNFSGMVAVK